MRIDEERLNGREHSWTQTKSTVDDPTHLASVLGGEPGDGDNKGEQENEVDRHPAEDAVGDRDELHGGVQQKEGKDWGQGVGDTHKDQTSPCAKNGNNNQSTLNKPNDNCI